MAALDEIGREEGKRDCAEEASGLPQIGPLLGHLSAWNQSSINKETLQGAPSEATFSAPYIVTVMHGIQLCSGSSRYRFRLSGLNNGLLKQKSPIRSITIQYRAQTVHFTREHPVTQ